MAAPSTTDPELEHVAWYLSDLLDGSDGDAAAAVERILGGARERSETFADTHRGKLETLDGAGMATAMRDLGEIEELVGRAYSYAALSFSTNTAEPARGA